MFLSFRRKKKQVRQDRHVIDAVNLSFLVHLTFFLQKTKELTKELT